MTRLRFALTWRLWRHWLACGGVWRGRRQPRPISRPELYRLMAHIRAEFSED